MRTPKSFGTHARIAVGLATALLSPALAMALTQTYNVTQPMLVDQPSTCAANSYYNGCSTTVLPGFAWTDTLPGGSTVSAVSIKFDDGVDCHTTGQVHTTKLNAINGPTWNTSVSDCFCAPLAKEVTVSMPVAAYTVGSVNTFRMTIAPTTCIGNAANGPTLGGFYAQVTVTYTAGSGSGTCADQPSVNKLETKLDDGTRFTSDAERNAQTTTVQTAITTASNNTITSVNARIATAQTAIIGEIDVNEAKLNKIETKLDASATEAKMTQRYIIEQALLNIDRTSVFYLPSSCGGRLEEVIAVLDEILDANESCGINIGGARTDQTQCHNEYNLGHWKAAFDACRHAYRTAATGG